MKIRNIDPYQGFTYEEVREKAAELIDTDIKIVQGTWTGEWYFIHTDDRDYNTPFAVTCQQFLNDILPSDTMVF